MKLILAMLALVAFAGSGTVVAAEKNSAKAASASQWPNQGKVLEVIDTSMYTYLQVSGAKGQVWIAASKTTVAKGDTIGYGAGSVMTNFHSKSLNRTFESIIFTDKVEKLK